MWWPCDDHVILASQFMVNWDFQGIWSDQHGNVDKTLNDKTGSLGWPRSRDFLVWVARGIMVKQHRMVRPRPFVCLHGFVQTGVYNKKLPLKWEKQCYRPLHFGVLSTCWKKSRLLFLGGYHHFYLSCVFLLSGPVYSCAAYVTVYAMPTWPQWGPTRLIPVKVCLRRPNARVKRRHNVRFCLRRHTSVCF